jgi:hypothetical protein
MREKAPLFEILINGMFLLQHMYHILLIGELPITPLFSSYLAITSFSFEIDGGKFLYGILTISLPLYSTIGYIHILAANPVGVNFPTFDVGGGGFNSGSIKTFVTLPSEYEGISSSILPYE